VVQKVSDYQLVNKIVFLKFSRATLALEYYKLELNILCTTLFVTSSITVCETAKRVKWVFMMKS